MLNQTLELHPLLHSNSLLEWEEVKGDKDLKRKIFQMQTMMSGRDMVAHFSKEHLMTLRIKKLMFYLAILMTTWMEDARRREKRSSRRRRRR